MAYFALLFELLVGKITRVIYTVSQEKQKKLHIRFLLIVYFIFKAHLSSSSFAIRSQVNYTLRSPFNNLRIIRLNTSHSLGFNCIILLTCLVLAGYIHSNPGPNSGREKFCHVSNILYIITTAHDFLLV